jgi:hypothetical protein
VRGGVLAVDDLPVVEVAEGVDELVEEVLRLGDGEPLASLDEFEHVLRVGRTTPLEHSYSSM